MPLEEVVARWLSGPGASNFIVSRILTDDAHYVTVACITVFFHIDRLGTHSIGAH
jgi:hypothetical protein